jgi:hypothetical protein
MLRPVPPKVSRQFIDRYPVDPRCPLVGLYSLQRLPHVLRFTYLLHQPLCRFSAFGFSFRHKLFVPPVVRRSFTPRLRHEGQLPLVFLPLSAHESLSLLASPFTPSFWRGTVQAFASSFPVLRPHAVSPLSGECPGRVNRLLPATMPSADSCIAVRVSLDSLSPVAGTRCRPPEVSMTAFRAQSPDLHFAPLMDMDFAIIGSLVQRSCLLSGFCPSTRAFARRFLQTPPHDGRPCAPLPFTSIRLGEDFHFQAVIQCSAHLLAPAPPGPGHCAAPPGPGRCAAPKASCFELNQQAGNVQTPGPFGPRPNRRLSDGIFQDRLECGAPAPLCFIAGAQNNGGFFEPNTVD